MTLTISLPVKMREFVAHTAKKQRRSMTSVIAEIVESALENEYTLSGERSYLSCQIPLALEQHIRTLVRNQTFQSIAEFVRFAIQLRVLTQKQKDSRYVHVDPACRLVFFENKIYERIEFKDGRMVWQEIK